MAAPVDSSFVIIDEEDEAPSHPAPVGHTATATPRTAEKGPAWTSRALIGSPMSKALGPPAVAPDTLPRIAWPSARVAVFVRMRPPVLANEGETAVHAVRESDDAPLTSIEVWPTEVDGCPL